MKSTKKSLIASALSLVLCVSMLLGTTYAWFTDSVTSGKNRIVAGNLDVELKHYTISAASATAVQGETDLFDVDLWEPGKVAFENFVISNEGTLAFKYNMAMAVADFNELNGHNLLEVLKVAIIDNGAFGDRNEDGEINRDDVTGLTFDKSLSDFTDTGWLAPKGNTAGDPSSKTFGVVIYWEPTDHDNDYNANNGQVTSDGDPLFVELGVNVIATQKDYEKDSFDEKYDLQAPLNSLASIINVEAKGNIEKDNLDGEIIIQDKATQEASKVYATVPAATDIDFEYKVKNADGSVSAMKKADVNDNDPDHGIVPHDDTLVLTFKTEKVEAGSVTYEISLKNETHNEDIAETNKVVKIKVNIGENLTGVKVKHSGVAMAEATTGADQTFSYDAATGDLTIWSKSFSPFEVSWNNEGPVVEVTKGAIGEISVYDIMAAIDSGATSMFDVFNFKAGTTTLATAYNFKALDKADDYDSIVINGIDYGKWHADFAVSFDKKIEKDSMGLYGQYDSWSDQGIGFKTPMDYDPADPDSKPIRLLGTAGISMTYAEICNIVKNFQCGAFNLSDKNIGTTMTVELRLYKTEGSTVGGAYDGETGEYITVGSYAYTFANTQTLTPAN